MNIESYLNQDWANNVVVPVTLTLLAIATILAINWGKIRARWLEWHTHRGLDKIGIKQIKNAICADGLDGEFEIDRLIMLHDSFLVIAFRVAGEQADKNGGINPVVILHAAGCGRC